MKKIILLFIIASLGFVMVGCHGCKEPVKDPCEGVEEVVADFKMEYSMGYNEDERWFDTDTFIINNYVRFSTMGEYDSVKWKIGLDPKVFTKRKFKLYFDLAVSIEVRMIGYRTPNLACFPNDDGIDTVYRQLVVVPKSAIKLPGEYEGHFLLEPDSSFVLSIIKDSITQRIWAYEFPKGCVKNDITGYLKWTQYKSFFTAKEGIGGDCPFPYAWGFLSNDTLTIDFHYQTQGSYVEDTFIGIKK